jgi:hypothetical protein
MPVNYGAVQSASEAGLGEAQVRVAAAAGAQRGHDLTRVRHGLLWLAGLSTLGIAADLAAERHWTQPVQLIAWAALGALSVSIALVVRGGSSTRLAQILAALVIVTSAIGVVEHVVANYEAGRSTFITTTPGTACLTPRAGRWR